MAPCTSRKGDDTVPRNLPEGEAVREPGKLQCLRPAKGADGQPLFVLRDQISTGQRTHFVIERVFAPQLLAGWCGMPDVGLRDKQKAAQ